MEQLECKSRGALWGDKDKWFDLELDNFGVGIETIHNTPTCPKRLFHCWIEDRVKPLLKINTAAAKHLVQNKYKGLFFIDDIPKKEVYTILEVNMYWKPFRGGNWCVIGEPAEYDGRNDEVLQPLVSLIRSH